MIGCVVVTSFNLPLAFVVDLLTLSRVPLLGFSYGMLVVTSGGYSGLTAAYKSCVKGGE